ncbi:hypothetical protein D3C87_1734090 [compost metagenome]
MLPKLHRGDRDRVMHVIGRGDDDGIECLRLLLEHLAVILIIRGVGKLLAVLFRLAVIDIAKRDDVFGTIIIGLPDIHIGFPTATDGGNVELVARRDEAPPQHVAWDDHNTARGQCAGFYKIPSFSSNSGYLFLIVHARVIVC